MTILKISTGRANSCDNTVTIDGKNLYDNNVNWKKKPYHTAVNIDRKKPYDTIGYSQFIFLFVTV